jgi:DNA-binding PadR family transcriptional regulator
VEFDKELVKGSIVPIVLELLHERDMYGYEIVRVVKERTQGRFEWKEGTLYPCLHRLEADGFIRSRWCASESGKMRKYYHVARKGLAELRKRKSEWREFAAAVNMLLMGAAG